MRLPDTDPDVLANGEHVAWVSGVSSAAIETWVRLVAADAEARMDWQQIGGRGRVLHLGDAESLARVVEAMSRLELALNGQIIWRLEGEAA